MQKHFLKIFIKLLNKVSIFNVEFSLFEVVEMF